MSEVTVTTEEQPTSEDKFFGVKTTFEKKQKPKQEAESNIEFEIVDDRPPEDRKPPRTTPPDELGDDELGEYSEKVQKRLKSLRFDYHEERRRKEDAERMRDEAVKYAQNLNSQVQEKDALLSRGEAALVEQIKQSRTAELAAQKEAYKKAYDEGDTDAIAESQSKMVKAQTDLNDIERYQGNLQKAQPQLTAQQQYQQQVAAQQEAQQAAQQQAVQQQVQLTPEAKEWADNNPWFMDTSKKAMTATAYGLHEEAVLDHGHQVNSQEYFDYVDKGMRKSYPDYDWPDRSDTDGGDAPVTTNQPSTVVAPSTRNNGAKPRQVRLTATQVALAKRLGLTNEQYAKHAELIK